MTRWSKTRMANVVTDPKAHPEVDHPGSDEAGSAAHVHARRHRVRLRHASGSSATSRRSATITSRCRRNGTSRNVVWRAVLRAAEHRLVGAVLSRRQQAAADGTAVRRLPFGELQRPDEDSRPNGTSAASAAMDPAASTSRRRAARTSSIPASSITCAPTTRASSATHRDSR